MATIGGALLLPPCVGPASITAVALSAVAMRANTEHGFASTTASRSKQDSWHPDDDKPPLRSGDDADGSLLNRRVIKKPHFLMRGDTPDSTVLIEGETGTGKELIAHAIHNASQRCGRAFIKLNCAAIPLDLLESELFGHEKGAFTGAIAQKIGRFEMADKGTLFLDEVGDIPSVLQPKLLRALQEQEFERLGSGRTHKVDVRLVAATNRNLMKMVARGQSQ